MTVGAKFSLLVLFAPLLIAGCAKKPVQAAQPAQTQAPAVATNSTPALYPPPLTQPPPDPFPQPTTPAPAAVAKTEPAPPPPPQQKPKKTTGRRTKPSPGKPADSTTPATADGTPAPPAATQTPATDTPAPTQQAAATAAPAEGGASPIGELTSGEESGSADLRRQTIDTIRTTDNGLNGIKRPLSNDEQTTAAQIRKFIDQAKQALGTHDLEGAHILAMKAKVLLEELTK